MIQDPTGRHPEHTTTVEPVLLAGQLKPVSPTGPTARAGHTVTAWSVDAYRRRWGWACC